MSPCSLDFEIEKTFEGTIGMEFTAYFKQNINFYPPPSLLTRPFAGICTSSLAYDYFIKRNTFITDVISSIKMLSRLLDFPCQTSAQIKFFLRTQK